MDQDTDFLLERKDIMLRSSATVKVDGASEQTDESKPRKNLSTSEKKTIRIKLAEQYVMKEQQRSNRTQRSNFCVFG